MADMGTGPSEQEYLRQLIAERDASLARAAELNKAIQQAQQVPAAVHATQQVLAPQSTQSKFPAASGQTIMEILQNFQATQQENLKSFIASEVKIPECELKIPEFVGGMKVKVPFLKGRPCLLFYDMPHIVEDLSKEAYAIWSKLDVDYQVQPIFGVSGCGKTRSAFEILSVSLGLYLSVDASSNMQSNDLSFAMDYVMRCVNILHPHYDTDTLQYELRKNSLLARGCIQGVLLARFWVLLCLFESMQDICVDEQKLEEIRINLPCKWLQLQLAVPSFGKYILKDLSKQLIMLYNDDKMELVLHDVFAKIRNYVDQMAGGKRVTFPVFVDEAQRFLTLGEKLFCSYNDTRRPMMTPIIQVLGALDTSVSLMGTGFSLTKCIEVSTSPGSVAKVLPKPDVFADFRGWVTEDQMLAYASYFMSIEHPFVKAEIHKWWLFLKGRYRPLVTCLEHACDGKTISEAFELVKRSLTDPNEEETSMYGDLVYESLYDQLVNLAKHRSAVVDGVNILALLETVTLQYAFLGSPFVFSSKKLMCLVEYGFAQVKSEPTSQSGLVAHISEPFAMYALCKYFESNLSSRWNRLSMAMSLLPSSAAAGFIWEKVITDDLRVVFGGKRTLEELELWSNIKDMPSIFRNKSAQVDSSSKHDIRLCREETLAYSFFEYLSMPAEDRPDFFFPDIYAGPDLVFFCSGIPCLLQLKLRRRLHEVGKALQTTDPMKLYTREDGSIHDEANTQKIRDLLLRICAEKGVIRILVAFPAAVRAKTHVRVPSPKLRNTSKKYCELVAIVSQGNVGCVLQEETISFLTALKDSMGRFTMDFMDEKDNFEGDE